MCKAVLDDDDGDVVVDRFFGIIVVGLPVAGTKAWPVVDSISKAKRAERIRVEQFIVYGGVSGVGNDSNNEVVGCAYVLFETIRRCLPASHPRAVTWGW
jgi:hypothetical protein